MEKGKSGKRVNMKEAMAESQARALPNADLAPTRYQTIEEELFTYKDSIHA